jgi:trimeric autotransporter adhesin
MDLLNMASYRFVSQYMLLFLTLLVALTLTACGGGGGGSSNSPSNTPITVDLTPVMTGMTPSSAAAGTKITVTGKNLSKVTTVRIGTRNFSPSFVSDTKLEFTVPAGARSARIELISPDGSSLSAATFVVTGVPTVGSVSPTTIVAGRNLTISGTNLNLISSITLNGVTLTIASGRSATALTVTIPTNAVDGLLTLVATDGGIDTVQIFVSAPLKLNSFTPASGLAGASITLDGTGLSRVTSINFTGTTTAATITAQSASSITVNVPAGASTGPIKLIAGSENASSNTNFTVIPRITVNGATAYNAATAGAAVTIVGTGLDQVSSVTVGSTNASITSKSATQLVFSAPSGILCGAITLSSLTQPSVSAGNLVVGAGCGGSDIVISGIEFAQVHSLSAGSPYQRLVPGKETWVRAYITSPTSNKTAPAVRLTALSGSAILGSLTMAGPTILPTLATGATPTDAMRYDTNQTFRVQLPNAWVASNLKVRVDVDPNNPAGVLATQEATPVVGNGFPWQLVLVPMTLGTATAVMPSTATVADAISRAMPIARGRLTVTIRAPYKLTTAPVPAGVDDTQAWYDALGELTALYNKEVTLFDAQLKMYYGFFEGFAGSSGIAGIADGQTGLSRDFRRPLWERFMLHELGHNISLPHVGACVGGFVDVNYPYPNGLMGAAPLFNSLTDLTQDPRTGNAIGDAMGYCYASYWFSDYNVHKMQKELERRAASIGVFSIIEKPAEREISLIMVSGLIDANGARITRVLPAQGLPQITNSTGYELELTTATGQTIRSPLQVRPVSHGSAMLFSASVANPGQLIAIRVLHNGKVIGEKTGSQQMKPGTNAPLTDAGVPWARVKESGASATFEWNAAYGTASITHLINGQNTVLTLGASGGRAVFDISHLPRGGVFEVGLSDGLNVQSLTLSR